MKLRKWVIVLLTIVNVIAFMIMGSDCESLKTFIVSHLIACLVFSFNSMIILKYGRIYQ